MTDSGTIICVFFGISVWKGLYILYNIFFCVSQNEDIFPTMVVNNGQEMFDKKHS